MLASLWATPPAVRVSLSLLLVGLAWLGGNWAYHTWHKPTELFFPLERSLFKTPRETWHQYGALFQTHSTKTITPELLAALAQSEGSGNPVARTYWRWEASPNPLQIYKPASSAVGMYQITDATFREAQRYCIHDHEVVAEGSWNEVKSCWFNSLYFRVVPSHAVELTSAFLDRSVAGALAKRRGRATLRQKQDLAAIIHLCGAGAGQSYVGRGFRLTRGQRCGDHDVRAYLSRIHALTAQFRQLAAGSSPSSLVQR
ncbi:transglycosylase [Nitrospira sp.]|nr:transglycosylase [Nitrospira sp.]